MRLIEEVFLQVYLSIDWFHVVPIASIELRLSDKATRIVVAHRLGCRTREPHVCVCKTDTLEVCRYPPATAR